MCATTQELGALRRDAKSSSFRCYLPRILAPSAMLLKKEMKLKWNDNLFWLVLADTVCRDSERQLWIIEMSNV